MTKAEIIETILLKVNGGKLTQDTKVRREDVEVLLAAATNMVLVESWWINKRQFGETDFPQDFIATYEDVEVKENTSRDLKYIDLVNGTLSTPNDRGLVSVSPMQGTEEYIQSKLTEEKHNSYYESSMRDVTRYWREGQKVYFRNLPDIVDKVLVRQIDAVSDIADDQEYPVPAGYETKVIAWLNDWLTGQKAMPADMINDNNGNV